MMSSKTKRISIIVPSYNHAPFIERCLKSIIKQTKSPSELLVIDDGSSDNSPKIIERILKDSPFPSELIVNANKGLCATLNEGLEKTSGDYFAYLGSDDLWFPEFLEARFRLLESRSNAVLGYGNAYFIDAGDNIFENTADWKNFEFSDGDARSMLYIGAAPISSTVFYRRTALEKRRWNENSRLEDYELYLQLAEDGEFAFDAGILAAWRKHGYNASRNLDLMLRECLNSQERMAKCFGWDNAKLDQIKTKTRFSYAREFDRDGCKLKACSLLMKNFRGAPSTKILGRDLLRIIIPTFILEIRKKSVRNKGTKHYGVVKV